MTYCDPAGYDRFMGRWSARLAPLFVRFAGVKDGERVLDIGCGTGILSRALLAAGPAVIVTGIDPVVDFVTFARNAVGDARATFQPGAAEALPFASGSFDAVLALLVLQDLADADRAVSEMARVTRRQGRVAACLWDFDQGLPLLSRFWEAAAVVAPRETARRRSQNPPRKPEGPADLTDRWRRAGLSAVAAESLTISMRFASFEDYWEPFTAGATPTSAFASLLNRQTDGALVRVLRTELAPILSADGSFELPARAWAVRGERAAAARGPGSRG